MSRVYKFEDDPQLLNIRLNVGMTGFGKTSLLELQLREIIKANRQRKRDRVILIDPSEDDFHFSWFGRRVTKATEIHSIIGYPIDAFHLRIISARPATSSSANRPS